MFFSLCHSLPAIINGIDDPESNQVLKHLAFMSRSVQPFSFRGP